MMRLHKRRGNVSVWIFLIAILFLSSFEAVEASNSELTSSDTYSLSDHETSASSSSASYTVFDDFSWPIRGPIERFSSNATRDRYIQFMEQCMEAVTQQSGDPNKAEQACHHGEQDRLRRNTLQPRGVYNYTQQGFLKRRVPEPLWTLLREFWHAHGHEAISEFGSSVSSYHNSWSSPPSIVHVANTSLTHGGASLMAALSDATQPVVEAWTGQRLAPSSVYGIRVYHNQSILAPHVDRFPLISSAIINVDQDVEEDWVLEVYDHDGVAHNVTMEPGDMVLYESHSVVHGRPFPLNGKYFANIFIHFEVIGDLDLVSNPVNNNENNIDDITNKQQSDTPLPPYLVPGSQWEKEYLRFFPRGWTLLSDVLGLIQRGDLPTLQYVGQTNPAALTRPVANDTLWQPIHMAAEVGHLHILTWLCQQPNVHVNAPFPVPNNTLVVTPVDVALRHFDNDEMHEVVKVLRRNGGRTHAELEEEREREEARSTVHEKVWETTIHARGESIRS